MIEILQAGYNPIELGWVVIESIKDLLTAQGNWDTTLDTTYELDRDIFADEESGEDFHAIEDEWRNSIAWKFGIAVYDDGMAGWTYVGTIAEIEALNGVEE